MLMGGGHSFTSLLQWPREQMASDTVKVSDGRNSSGLGLGF